MRTWHPLSAIYLLNCSVAINMHSGIRIVHLYPSRKQLYQLKYNSYVQFLLLGVRDSFDSFPELLKSAPFPTSVKLFHIFVVHLQTICHSLHFILESLDLFNLQIKVYSLCCEVLWVLTNA